MRLAPLAPDTDSIRSRGRRARLRFLFALILLVVTAVTPGTSTAAGTAQLVALNLASGAQAWSLSVDGMIHDLEVTSTGLLGIVSKYVAATGSATQGTVSRSLVSINLSGSIVWTLALD